MKLFLAIDLPAASKKKLDQQIEKLKKDYPQFSWVTPENFHITLHFFGETNQLERIKKKVREAIYDANLFYLYSLGANLFINKKIVLYIYFKREKRLEELTSKIKKIFQAEEVKKFVPHLTIARYRIPSKQQYLNLKKKLQQLPLEIDFSIKKIYLFQSILEGQKPIYKKITSFSLLIPLR